MATATATPLSKLEEILGEDAQDLLEHRCQTVSRDQLLLPGPDFVDRVFAVSDRNPRVLRSLQTIFAQDISSDLYEIIVVVDGSTDGTAEALRKPATAAGMPQ